MTVWMDKKPDSHKNQREGLLNRIKSAFSNSLPKKIQKSYYVGKFALPNSGTHQIYSKKDLWLYGDISFWRKKLETKLGKDLAIFFVAFIVSLVAIWAAILYPPLIKNNFKEFFSVSAQVIATAIGIPLTIMLVFVQIKMRELGEYATTLTWKSWGFNIYVFFTIIMLIFCLGSIGIPADNTEELKTTAQIIFFLEVLVLLGLIWAIQSISRLFTSTFVAGKLYEELEQAIKRKEAQRIHDLLTTLARYHRQEIMQGNLNSLKNLTEIANDLLKDSLRFERYYYQATEEQRFERRITYPPNWLQNKLCAILIAGQIQAIRSGQEEISEEINTATTSIVIEVLNNPTEVHQFKKLFALFGRAIAEYSQQKQDVPQIIESNWRHQFETMITLEPNSFQYLLGYMISLGDATAMKCHPENFLVLPYILLNAARHTSPFRRIDKANYLILSKYLAHYQRMIEDIAKDSPKSKGRLLELIKHTETLRYLISVYLVKEENVSAPKLRKTFKKITRKRLGNEILKEIELGWQESWIKRTIELLFTKFNKNKNASEFNKEQVKRALKEFGN